MLPPKKFNFQFARCSGGGDLYPLSGRKDAIIFKNNFDPDFALQTLRSGDPCNAN